MLFQNSDSTQCSYAAIAALATIGTPRALSVIDRASLQRFLRRMCVPRSHGGGLTVHDGGEADIRAAYLAVAAARLAHIDTAPLEAAGSIVDYVCRCQTYEVRITSLWLPCRCGCRSPA